MRALFLSIQERLKTINDIKYVDEDWGQLEDYSPNTPSKFPLALIDLDSIDWSNTADLMQRGEGDICVTIADYKLTRSNANASTEQREKAFGIFDLIDQVHAKLHGWNPCNGTNMLVRAKTQKVKRDDGMKEYKIFYSIVVETEKPEKLTAPATINIQTERI